MGEGAYDMGEGKGLLIWGGKGAFDMGEGKGLMIRGRGRGL